MENEIAAFLAIFPEFLNVPILRIQFALTNSINLIESEIWGLFQQQAIYLLTAHTLSSMGTTNTIGGVIDRIRIEGDIEIESSADYKPKNSLDITSYGREFNQLKATVIGGFITCT